MRDEGRGGAYPPDGQDGGGEDGGERQRHRLRKMKPFSAFIYSGVK